MSAGIAAYEVEKIQRGKSACYYIFRNETGAGIRASFSFPYPFLFLTYADVRSRRTLDR